MYRNKKLVRRQPSPPRGALVTHDGVPEEDLVCLYCGKRPRREGQRKARGKPWILVTFVCDDCGVRWKVPVVARGA